MLHKGTQGISRTSQPEHKAALRVISVALPPTAAVGFSVSLHYIRASGESCQSHGFRLLLARPGMFLGLKKSCIPFHTSRPQGNPQWVKLSFQKRIRLSNCVVKHSQIKLHGWKSLTPYSINN